MTDRDTVTLLARVNRRIALLREWLSHDHGDQPYWWARQCTASVAQRERAALRCVAHLLHVERAHARGRIHCQRLPDLESQRAWLAEREHRKGLLVGVPRDATLALLRDGKLPL